MGCGIGVTVAGGGAVGCRVGARVGGNSVGATGVPDPQAARKIIPVKTTGNVLLNVMVFLLKFDYTIKRPNELRVDAAGDAKVETAVDCYKETAFTAKPPCKYGVDYP